MPGLKASDVARVTGGRLVGGDVTADGLVADSRDVRAGVAFAAIAGGHAFIPDAVSRDAAFVIAERDVEHGVIVDDTVAGLMKVAAFERNRRDLLVVGVTGSTGKTLTKDFLAATIGVSKRVHATPKSFNAEIGVPLTLFGTPDDADVLIAELAARHRGEIGELCEIVRPSVGVITGIGITHIEEFGDRRTIATTKSELLRSLPPGGLAVVPSNDDYLHLLAASTSARVVTVGPGGIVRYRAERIDGDGRTHGTVTAGDRVLDVTLPVAGRALMRNAAIAIAVAAELGADPEEAAAALGHASSSSWRMEIVRAGGRTIVNDAYNSNPTSLASSLRATRELAGSRPVWAVLGPMAELGEETSEEHRRAGRLAAGLGYQGVIAVDAAEIGDAAGPIAIQVGSLAEAVEAVRDRTPSDAVVVVKASRVAGLERLVDQLRSSGDRERAG